MTRIGALKVLADKVEAGAAEAKHFQSAFITPYDESSVETSNRCLHAYHGSLDAAKALHESVLTGCSQYSIETDPTCLRVIVSWWPEWLSGNREIQGVAWHEDNPARAWLLAIIRALIAQEKAL